MSSTTPGQGPSEDMTQPQRAADGSQASTSEGRAAMRTSLAERFAAARGVEEHPVVPRPDETAPAGGASSSPVQEQPRVSGGTAPAPRYGATGTSTSQPAAQAAGQQASPQSASPRRETSTPEEAPRGAARPGAGPRRVRLSVARVDPWSVMKLSFLLSIAIGIGIVVAAAAMWFVLDSMHVFADVEELLVTLDSENFLQLMDYVQFDRVVSMAAIVAVVDIVLLTALSTLGAFLYNIVAALVGGIHLTLTDD